MKKVNKKIIISIFVFLIILLLSISIIIANNAVNKTNFEIDKNKIYHEIAYFDSQIIYMMTMLNNIDRNENFYIDWKELQKQNQILYNYWNSVILDLNYSEIDKNNLTDFSNSLDELNISIKNNDKEMTLQNLLDLYNKLIIYSETINNVTYNLLLDTKYNLLIAYSIAEKGNWTLIYEHILKASENMSNMVKQIDNNQYNQYNINQAYISVKELENIINIKDTNIFYMKYKIAMNNIKKIKTGEA